MPSASRSRRTRGRTVSATTASPLRCPPGMDRWDSLLYVVAPNNLLQRYLTSVRCLRLKWRKPSQQVRKCPVKYRKIREHKLGSGPHGHERDHRRREQEGRQEEGEEGGRCRRPHRLLRRLMRHLVNANISLSAKLNSTHRYAILSYKCMRTTSRQLSIICL